MHTNKTFDTMVILCVVSAAPGRGAEFSEP